MIGHSRGSYYVLLRNKGITNNTTVNINPPPYRGVVHQKKKRIDNVFQQTLDFLFIQILQNGVYGQKEERRKRKTISNHQEPCNRAGSGSQRFDSRSWIDRKEPVWCPPVVLAWESQARAQVVP